MTEYKIEAKLIMIVNAVNESEAQQHLEDFAMSIDGGSRDPSNDDHQVKRAYITEGQKITRV